MKISNVSHRRKREWKFMEIFQFACVCFILAVIYSALIIAHRTSTPALVWMFVLPIASASPLLLSIIYDHYFGDK